MLVLDPDQLFRSLVVMNALFASIAWCLSRPNWASILAVVVFAAIWPFANGELEGATLVVLGDDHGITDSDLLSVFAFVIAAVQLARLIWAGGSRP